MQPRAAPSGSRRSRCSTSSAIWSDGAASARRRAARDRLHQRRELAARARRHSHARAPRRTALGAPRWRIFARLLGESTPRCPCSAVRASSSALSVSAACCSRWVLPTCRVSTPCPRRIAVCGRGHLCHGVLLASRASALRARRSARARQRRRRRPRATGRAQQRLAQRPRAPRSRSWSS